MVRPERFELPTFWFVARRWMILCIFVESKKERAWFPNGSMLCNRLATS